jgi:hypothetical protein
MVPWQDVRAPISAVLAAKRLDHSLRPFSSLPSSKHMTLTYPHRIFQCKSLLYILKEGFPQKGPMRGHYPWSEWQPPRAPHHPAGWPLLGVFMVPTHKLPY